MDPRQELQSRMARRARFIRARAMDIEAAMAQDVVDVVGLREDITMIEEAMAQVKSLMKGFES
jgi:hypothetical protein